MTMKRIVKKLMISNKYLPADQLNNSHLNRRVMVYSFINDETYIGIIAGVTHNKLNGVVYLTLENATIINDQNEPVDFEDQLGVELDPDTWVKFTTNENEA